MRQSAEFFGQEDGYFFQRPENGDTIDVENKVGESDTDRLMGTGDERGQESRDGRPHVCAQQVRENLFHVQNTRAAEGDNQGSGYRRRLYQDRQPDTEQETQGRVAENIALEENLDPGQDQGFQNLDDIAQSDKQQEKGYDGRQPGVVRSHLNYFVGYRLGNGSQGGTELYSSETGEQTLHGVRRNTYDIEINLEREKDQYGTEVEEIVQYRAGKGPLVFLGP